MQLRTELQGRGLQVASAVSGPAESSDLALAAAAEVMGLKRHEREALAQQYAQGMALAPALYFSSGHVATRPGQSWSLWSLYRLDAKKTCTAWPKVVLDATRGSSIAGCTLTC